MKEAQNYLKTALTGVSPRLSLYKLKGRSDFSVIDQNLDQIEFFFDVCIHSAAEWALAWPAPPAFSWSCHLLCPSFPLIRSLGMRQNHAQWLAWQSAFLQLSNDTQLAVLLPFDAKQRHFFSNKLTWPWRRLSVDCAPFLAIAPSSS